jgi:hypothetical protein
MDTTQFPSYLFESLHEVVVVVVLSHKMIESHFKCGGPFVKKFCELLKLFLFEDSRGKKLAIELLTFIVPSTQRNL